MTPVFSRLAPKPIAIEFWQNPETLGRLDCTGCVPVLHKTTLPFNPVLSTVDAAQGRFAINAPTDAELDLVPRDDQSRAFDIEFRVMEGATVIEGGRLTVQVVE